MQRMYFSRFLTIAILICVVFLGAPLSGSALEADPEGGNVNEQCPSGAQYTYSCQIGTTAKDPTKTCILNKDCTNSLVQGKCKEQNFCQAVKCFSGGTWSDCKATTGVDPAKGDDGEGFGDDRPTPPSTIPPPQTQPLPQTPNPNAPQLPTTPASSPPPLPLQAPTPTLPENPLQQSLDKLPLNVPPPPVPPPKSLTQQFSDWAKRISNPAPTLLPGQEGLPQPTIIPGNGSTFGPPAPPSTAQDATQKSVIGRLVNWWGSSGDTMSSAESTRGFTPSTNVQPTDNNNFYGYGDTPQDNYGYGNPDEGGNINRGAQNIFGSPQSESASPPPEGFFTDARQAMESGFNSAREAAQSFLGRPFETVSVVQNVISPSSAASLIADTLTDFASSFSTAPQQLNPASWSQFSPTPTSFSSIPYDIAAMSPPVANGFNSSALFTPANFSLSGGLIPKGGFSQPLNAISQAPTFAPVNSVVGNLVYAGFMPPLASIQNAAQTVQRGFTQLQQYLLGAPPTDAQKTLAQIAAEANGTLPGTTLDFTQPFDPSQPLLNPNNPITASPAITTTGLDSLQEYLVDINSPLVPVSPSDLPGAVIVNAPGSNLNQETLGIPSRDVVQLTQQPLSDSPFSLYYPQPPCGDGATCSVFINLPSEGGVAVSSPFDFGVRSPQSSLGDQAADIFGYGNSNQEFTNEELLNNVYGYGNPDIREIDPLFDSFGVDAVVLPTASVEDIGPLADADRLFDERIDAFMRVMEANPNAVISVSPELQKINDVSLYQQLRNGSGDYSDALEGIRAYEAVQPYERAVIDSETLVRSKTEAAQKALAALPKNSAGQAVCAPGSAACSAYRAAETQAKSAASALADAKSQYEAKVVEVGKAIDVTGRNGTEFDALVRGVQNPSLATGGAPDAKAFAENQKLIDAARSAYASLDPKNVTDRQAAFANIQQLENERRGIVEQMQHAAARNDVRIVGYGPETTAILPSAADYKAFQAEFAPLRAEYAEVSRLTEANVQNYNQIVQVENSVFSATNQMQSEIRAAQATDARIAEILSKSNPYAEDYPTNEAAIAGRPIVDAQARIASELARKNAELAEVQRKLGEFNFFSRNLPYLGADSLNEQKNTLNGEIARLQSQFKEFGAANNLLIDPKTSGNFTAMLAENPSSAEVQAAIKLAVPRDEALRSLQSAVNVSEAARLSAISDGMFGNGRNYIDEKPRLDGNVAAYQREASKFDTQIGEVLGQTPRTEKTNDLIVAYGGKIYEVVPGDATFGTTDELVLNPRESSLRVGDSIVTQARANLSDSAKWVESFTSPVGRVFAQVGSILEVGNVFDRAVIGVTNLTFGTTEYSIDSALRNPLQQAFLGTGVSLLEASGPIGFVSPSRVAVEAAMARQIAEAGLSAQRTAIVDALSFKPTFAEGASARAEAIAGTYVENAKSTLRSAVESGSLSAEEATVKVYQQVHQDVSAGQRLFGSDGARILGNLEAEMTAKGISPIVSGGSTMADARAFEAAVTNLEQSATREVRAAQVGTDAYIIATEARESALNLKMGTPLSPPQLSNPIVQKNLAEVLGYGPEQINAVAARQSKLAEIQGITPTTVTQQVDVVQKNLARLEVRPQSPISISESASASEKLQSQMRAGTIANPSLASSEFTRISFENLTGSPLTAGQIESAGALKAGENLVRGTSEGKTIIAGVAQAQRIIESGGRAIPSILAEDAAAAEKFISGGSANGNQLGRTNGDVVEGLTGKRPISLSGEKGLAQNVIDGIPGAIQTLDAAIQPGRLIIATAEDVGFLVNRAIETNNVPLQKILQRIEGAIADEMHLLVNQKTALISATDKPLSQSALLSSKLSEMLKVFEAYVPLEKTTSKIAFGNLERKIFSIPQAQTQSLVDDFVREGSTPSYLVVEGKVNGFNQAALNALKNIERLTPTQIEGMKSVLQTFEDIRGAGNSYNLVSKEGAATSIHPTSELGKTQDRMIIQNTYYNVGVALKEGLIPLDKILSGVPLSPTELASVKVSRATISQLSSDTLQNLNPNFELVGMTATPPSAKLANALGFSSKNRITSATELQIAEKFTVIPNKKAALSSADALTKETNLFIATSRSDTFAELSAKYRAMQRENKIESFIELGTDGGALNGVGGKNFDTLLANVKSNKGTVVLVDAQGFTGKNPQFNAALLMMEPQAAQLMAQGADRIGRVNRLSGVRFEVVDRILVVESESIADRIVLLKNRDLQSAISNAFLEQEGLTGRGTKLFERLSSGDALTLPEQVELVSRYEQIVENTRSAHASAGMLGERNLIQNPIKDLLRTNLKPETRQALLDINADAINTPLPQGDGRARVYGLADAGNQLTKDLQSGIAAKAIDTASRVEKLLLLSGELTGTRAEVVAKWQSNIAQLRNTDVESLASYVTTSAGKNGTETLSIIKGLAENSAALPGFLNADGLREGLTRAVSSILNSFRVTSELAAESLVNEIAAAIVIGDQEVLSNFGRSVAYVAETVRSPSSANVVDRISDALNPKFTPFSTEVAQLVLTNFVSSIQSNYDTSSLESVTTVTILPNDILTPTAAEVIAVARDAIANPEIAPFIFTALETPAEVARYVSSVSETVSPTARVEILKAAVEYDAARARMREVESEILNSSNPRTRSIPSVFAIIPVTFWNALRNVATDIRLNRTLAAAENAEKDAVLTLAKAIVNADNAAIAANATQDPRAITALESTSLRDVLNNVNEDAANIEIPSSQSASEMIAAADDIPDLVVRLEKAPRMEPGEAEKVVQFIVKEASAKESELALQTLGNLPIPGWQDGRKVLEKRIAEYLAATQDPIFIPAAFDEKGELTAVAENLKRRVEVISGRSSFDIQKPVRDISNGEIQAKNDARPTPFSIEERVAEQALLRALTSSLALYRITDGLTRAQRNTLRDDLQQEAVETRSLYDSNAMRATNTFTSILSAVKSYQGSALVGIDSDFAEAFQSLTEEFERLGTRATSDIYEAMSQVEKDAFVTEMYSLISLYDTLFSYSSGELAVLTAIDQRVVSRELTEGFDFPRFLRSPVTESNAPTSNFPNTSLAWSTLGNLRSRTNVPIDAVAEVGLAIIRDVSNIAVSGANNLTSRIRGTRADTASTEVISRTGTDDPRELAIVVFADGELVANAYHRLVPQAPPQPSFIKFEGLIVRGDENQGKGYGTLIVEHIKNVSLSSGVPIVLDNTINSRGIQRPESVRQIYQKAGFVPVPGTTYEIFDPQGTLTESQRLTLTKANINGFMDGGRLAWNLDPTSNQVTISNRLIAEATPRQGNGVTEATRRTSQPNTILNAIRSVVASAFFLVSPISPTLNSFSFSNILGSVPAQSAVPTTDTTLAQKIIVQGVESGIASTYDPNFSGYKTGGQQMSTMERYNPYEYQAALQLNLAQQYRIAVSPDRIKRAPFGFAIVRNNKNGKELIVRINNNGPLVGSRKNSGSKFRVIDLNTLSMQYLVDKKFTPNKELLPDVTVAILQGTQHVAGPVVSGSLTAAVQDGTKAIALGASPTKQVEPTAPSRAPQLQSLTITAAPVPVVPQPTDTPPLEVAKVGAQPVVPEASSGVLATYLRDRFSRSSTSVQPNVIATVQVPELVGELKIQSVIPVNVRNAVAAITETSEKYLLQDVGGKKIGELIEMTRGAPQTEAEAQVLVQKVKQAVTTSARLPFVILDPSDTTKEIVVWPRETLRIQLALEKAGLPSIAPVYTRHYAFERVPKADGSVNFNKRHEEAWKKILAEAELLDDGSGRYVFKDDKKISALMQSIKDAEGFSGKTLHPNQNYLDKNNIQVLVGAAALRGERSIGFILATTEYGHQTHTTGTDTDFGTGPFALAKDHRWRIEGVGSTIGGNALAAQFSSFLMAQKLLDNSLKLSGGFYPSASGHIGAGKSSNSTWDFGNPFMGVTDAVRRIMKGQPRNNLAEVQNYFSESTNRITFADFTRIRDTSIYVRGKDGAPQYVFKGGDSKSSPVFALQADVVKIFADQKIRTLPAAQALSEVVVTPEAQKSLQPLVLTGVPVVVSPLTVSVPDGTGALLKKGTTVVTPGELKSLTLVEPGSIETQPGALFAPARLGMPQGGAAYLVGSDGINGLSAQNVKTVFVGFLAESSDIAAVINSGRYVGGYINPLLQDVFKAEALRAGVAREISGTSAQYKEPVFDDYTSPLARKYIDTQYDHWEKNANTLTDGTKGIVVDLNNCDTIGWTSCKQVLDRIFERSSASSIAKVAVLVKNPHLIAVGRNGTGIKRGIEALQHPAVVGAFIEEVAKFSALEIISARDEASPDREKIIASKRAMQDERVTRALGTIDALRTAAGVPEKTILVAGGHLANDVIGTVARLVEKGVIPNAIVSVSGKKEYATVSQVVWSPPKAISLSDVRIAEAKAKEVAVTNRGAVTSSEANTSVPVFDYTPGKLSPDIIAAGERLLAAEEEDRRIAEKEAEERAKIVLESKSTVKTVPVQAAFVDTVPKPLSPIAVSAAPAQIQSPIVSPVSPLTLSSAPAQMQKKPKDSAVEVALQALNRRVITLAAAQKTVEIGQRSVRRTQEVITFANVAFSSGRQIDSNNTAVKRGFSATDTLPGVLLSLGKVVPVATAKLPNEITSFARNMRILIRGDVVDDGLTPNQRLGFGTVLVARVTNLLDLAQEKIEAELITIKSEIERNRGLATTQSQKPLTLSAQPTTPVVERLSPITVVKPKTETNLDISQNPLEDTKTDLTSSVEPIIVTVLPTLPIVPPVTPQEDMISEDVTIVNVEKQYLNTSLDARISATRDKENKIAFDLERMYRVESVDKLPPVLYPGSKYGNFRRTQYFNAREERLSLEMQKTQEQINSALNVEDVSPSPQLKLAIRDLDTLLSEQQNTLGEIRTLKEKALDEYRRSYADETKLTTEKLTKIIKNGGDAIAFRLGDDWRSIDITTNNIALIDINDINTQKFFEDMLVRIQNKTFALNNDFVEVEKKLTEIVSGGERVAKTIPQVVVGGESVPTLNPKAPQIPDPTNIPPILPIGRAPVNAPAPSNPSIPTRIRSLFARIRNVGSLGTQSASVTTPPAQPVEESLIRRLVRGDGAIPIASDTVEITSAPSLTFLRNNEYERIESEIAREFVAEDKDSAENIGDILQRYAELETELRAVALQVSGEKGGEIRKAANAIAEAMRAKTTRGDTIFWLESAQTFLIGAQQVGGLAAPVQDTFVESPVANVMPLPTLTDALARALGVEAQAPIISPEVRIRRLAEGIQNGIDMSEIVDMRSLARSFEATARDVRVEADANMKRVARIPEGNQSNMRNAAFLRLDAARAFEFAAARLFEAADIALVNSDSGRAAEAQALEARRYAALGTNFRARANTLSAEVDALEISNVSESVSAGVERTFDILKSGVARITQTPIVPGNENTQLPYVATNVIPPPPREGLNFRALVTLLLVRTGLELLEGESPQVPVVIVNTKSRAEEDIAFVATPLLPVPQVFVLSNDNVVRMLTGGILPDASTLAKDTDAKAPELFLRCGETACDREYPAGDSRKTVTITDSKGKVILSFSTWQEIGVGADGSISIDGAKLQERINEEWERQGLGGTASNKILPPQLGNVDSTTFDSKQSSIAVTLKPAMVSPEPGIPEPGRVPADTVPPPRLVGTPDSPVAPPPPRTPATPDRLSPRDTSMPETSATSGFSSGFLAQALKPLAELMQLFSGIFGAPVAPSTSQGTVTSQPKIPTAAIMTSERIVDSGSSVRVSWTSEYTVACVLYGPGGEIGRGGSAGGTTTPPLLRSAQFAVRCLTTTNTYVIANTVVLVDGAPFDTEPVQISASSGQVIDPRTGLPVAGSTQIGGGTGTAAGGTTQSGAAYTQTGGGGNYNGEPPGSSVAPPVSGYLQDGKTTVSAWCDPEQQIDSFIRCLQALPK